MAPANPTEDKFEDHIEKKFHEVGYISKSHPDYDRSLCLIREELIAFLQASQPIKWNKLQGIHGIDVQNRVLQRISKTIAKRGIIDTLRKPVEYQGIDLDLCYFKPKSSLNPEHGTLFQRNRFSLIRQLRYSTKNNKSVDIVLFINGIPIVTIELKNQLTGQSIEDAENQYKKDRDPTEPLFRFKRCVAHFCVDNSKASMTTKLARDNTYFLPYNKALDNPIVEYDYATSYIWNEVLTPDSLLNILEKFVVISTQKKYSYNEKEERLQTHESEVLIFPRYHQLDLIQKLRTRVRQDGVGKNYLIQHTTGSGKSFSIGWLAHTLTSMYRKELDLKRMFDSIVIITDRKVLDSQIRSTVKSLERTEGVVSAVEKGSAQLKEFLEQGKDIVISTIQKFPYISETIASLGHKSFAVIIDEVHSSQSGEFSKKLKTSLSKIDIDGEIDYEKWITDEMEKRGRQKHISYFGFTGTSKEKTLELFGEKTENGEFVPFHIYSMQQSIKEKFTLDVLQNYTTYKRFIELNQIDGKRKILPVSRTTKELIHYVDSSEMAIREKATIMLDHWINKGSKEILGHAVGMIVTNSRLDCVKYFFEIKKQLKKRGINYRPLVAFSGKVDYPKKPNKIMEYTETRLNKKVGHKGNIPLGLKNPKYRLLIIANKFQTGFDEPLAQTMYVDKFLGGVQCVQTLSRLNRTMPSKSHTFVLDFKNSPEAIQSAFQRFYKSTMLESETDPDIIYDTLNEIEGFGLYTFDEVNAFCEVFYREDSQNHELNSILIPATNNFKDIEDREQQAKIKSKIQKYLRMYSYLSQIVNFQDENLEKSFLFLKYLSRTLPKNDRVSIDVSKDVELLNLRFQKIHEKIGDLSDEDSVANTLSFGESGKGEPETQPLSEIIERLNEKHGSIFTEIDQQNMERVQDDIQEDQNIRQYMQGDNSQDNKEVFFKEQFDKFILGLVNDNIELYTKLHNEPSIKRTIFQGMLLNYQKELNRMEAPTAVQ